MHLRDKIDQRIADCLNQLDRFWLFTAVLLAADDLEIQRAKVFEKGDIDLWAAGLIIAIARHNRLDSEEGVMNLNFEEIAIFYGVDSLYVTEKANEIHEMLKLGELNMKYREYDFSYLEDEEEFITEGSDLWMQVKVKFKNKAKIDVLEKTRLEELITELLVEVNEDEEESNFLRIIDIEVEGYHLIVGLEGYDGDIDFFCHLMEEEGLGVIEIDELNGGENLFLPDEHYTLFMEQHEAMNLEEKQFNSLEEIQQELDAKFKGKSLDEIKSANPLSPEGQAMIDAIKAFSLPKEASIERINQILEEQPNCVEAHICLAGWEKDPSRRIALLEDALAAGDASLDIAEIDRRKSWWGDHRTRPYMRAMKLLGHELFSSGDEGNATDILWELLEMNESDNQGNRFILMELLIIKKRWVEVRELFAKYPDEVHLIFIYGKAIYLYYTLGNKSKSKKALIKAYQRNIYPIRLIVGIEEYPEETNYFKFGDKVEATEIINFLTVCFEDKKLVHWVFEVLMKSGEWVDERRGFERGQSAFFASDN
jgi:hypothetical protein